MGRGGGGWGWGGPLGFFFFLASLRIACWDPLQIDFFFSLHFFKRKKNKLLGCFYVVVAV